MTKILYVPIGVGTYHMDTAAAVFAESAALLRALSEGAVCPAKPLLTKEAVRAFLEENADGAGLLILQNLTFANAAYTREILDVCPGVPMILWTVREPAADGGRLKGNGLTGAFAAGHTVCMAQGAPFADTFIGLPMEEETARHLAAALAAAEAKAYLSGLVLGLVGEPPEGFEFGKGSTGQLERVFGVRTAQIAAETLMERARQVPDERMAAVLAEAESMLAGLSETPEENRRGFARLLAAYRDWTKEAGVNALASRCWPDFFTEYGTPVCAVLSMLNDEGVFAACEGDRIGALSMALAGFLSGGACFFGDPVAMDPENNTVTFWHCGMAPCSLARKPEGPCVGVHPNRKIGPTMEFGCRPAEKATILRIGETPKGGFRLFVATGSIEDAPRQYFGTSVVVKTAADAEMLVTRAIRGGWEPHFVVAEKDIAAELMVWAKMMGMEVVCYDGCPCGSKES